MTQFVRMAFAVAALAAFTLPVAAQEVRQTDKAQSQFAPESTTSTAAANPAARKTKDLLAEGYEFKAFSIVPRAIVTGGGSTLDVDAVVFILQKGEQLANCYVTYDSFVNGSYYNGEISACTVLK